MTIDQGLKVTQEDRDAAANIAATLVGMRSTERADALFASYSSGRHDKDALVQAFARHRLAARTPSPSLPSREAILEQARKLAADAVEARKSDTFTHLLILKGERDWHPAVQAALAALSLLPVNGWREGVEAAAKVADRLAALCTQDHLAGPYEETAKAIRALSAAPGEGAS